MNHLKNFSLAGIAVIFLSFFILFNPNSNFDVLAFLLIGFIILQKIFGEYFILILLAFRPTLDYWRDYNIFSSRFFDFNINAALSAFLLIWSVIFFIKNYQLFKAVPLKILWFALLAWCASSLFYSYNSSSTIIETVKLSSLFSLFGICYVMSLKDKERFREHFFRAMLAGAVIPIATAVWQLLTKTGMTIDDVSNRIYGTFAHPNVLATFALLLLIVLTDEFIKTEKSNNKKLNLLSMSGTVLVAIIIFTYTRIAWISMVLLFVFVGLVFYRRILVYSLAGVALLYTLFFPFNRFLVTGFDIHLQNNSIINRLTTRNQDSDSIAWRTDLIYKIIPLFIKNPVTGYGYGTFPNVWDDNKDIQNIWDNTSEAHNDYIKIGLESGIIGLILFLALFAVLLYKQIHIAVRTHFKNIVFLSSIIIYLVLSLSDNMLHHTPVIWWFWAVWGVWIENSKS